MARTRRKGHWDPTKHLRAGKGATGGQGGRFVKTLVGIKNGETREHPDTGVKVKAGTISHQGRTRRVYSVEGGTVHRSAESAAAAAGAQTAGAGGGVGDFSGPGTHTGWLGRYRKWNLADLEQENKLLASEPERFDANSIQVRRSAMRTALREAQEKDSSVDGVKGKFKKGDTVYHVDDAGGSKEADPGSWGGQVEDVRADAIGNGKLEYLVHWGESKSSVWVPEGFLMNEKDFKDSHMEAKKPDPKPDPKLPPVGSTASQHDGTGRHIRDVRILAHNADGTVKVKGLNGPMKDAVYNVDAAKVMRVEKKKPDPKPQPDDREAQFKKARFNWTQADKRSREGRGPSAIQSAERNKLKYEEELKALGARYDRGKRAWVLDPKVDPKPEPFKMDKYVGTDELLIDPASGSLTKGNVWYAVRHKGTNGLVVGRLVPGVEGWKAIDKNGHEIGTWLDLNEAKAQIARSISGAEAPKPEPDKGSKGDGMTVKMKGRKFVYELRVNGEVVASRTSEVPYAWARKKEDPAGGFRYSFHKTKPSGGVAKYQLQQPEIVQYEDAEDPNSAIGKEAAKARNVIAKVRARTDRLPGGQIRESKVDLYDISETDGRAQGEHKGSIQVTKHTTEELTMIGEYVHRVLAEIDFDHEDPKITKLRAKRIEGNNNFAEADRAWRSARADNRANTPESQAAHRDEIKRLATLRDEAKLAWAKAGRDYESQVAPGLAAAREKLGKEIEKHEKLNLARMEWQQEHPGVSIYTWKGKGKLDRASGAVDRATREVAVQQRYYEEVQAARVTRALRAVRPGFGTGEFKTNGTHISDLFDLAGKHLPKEWVDAMMGSYGRGPIRVVQRQGARAHYDKWASGGGEILMASGSRSYSTALHEVGHYVEDVLPAVKSMEAEFYKRRTGNEVARQLNRINPGHGYRKDEKAREDKFVSAYMGKDYGGSFYELLTMGLQGVFYNDHNLRSADREYFNWMLGLLAAA